MSVQTLDQRLTALLFLRRRIDAEIVELAKDTGRRIRRRDHVPPCGTEQAYQRHRYYGEPRDELCKAAHRLHNRAQREAS
jgi:hypothetical protein